ncbi:hypothetical protein [Larkinella soli]|uniref:hypothetical protein n=1 Tax=Larkinella soli TaxID=1770527 RepID=UPI000FFC5921|nr:hypothetical protein [Larkinella soli]
MIIDHPTPQEVALIQQAQQRRWAILNAKPYWSEDDFEEALHCHNTWLPEAKSWNFSLQTLEMLAFDPRTPDSKAHTLQQLITQFRQPS